MCMSLVLRVVERKLSDVSCGLCGKGFSGNNCFLNVTQHFLAHHINLHGMCGRIPSICKYIDMRIENKMNEKHIDDKLVQDREKKKE